MGAYDNPRIIQPVNYAEIYARTGQNIVNAFNAYMEDDARKTSAAKKLISESEARVTEFGNKALEINQGSFIGSVTDIASGTTSEYANLERLKLRGEISSAEYNQKVTNLYGKINEVKGVAEAFEEFEKNIPEDLSSFQLESGRLFGLIEAKKKGELNAYYEGNELKFSYKDIDGTTKRLSAAELANAENQFVNTKINAAAEVETAIDVVNGLKQKTSQEITVKRDDGSDSRVIVERWADEKYSNEEELVDHVKSSSASPISDMNIYEAGSFLTDVKFKSGVNVASEQSFQNAINNSGLDAVAKARLIKDIENGTYSKMVPNKDGELVDTSAVVVEYAKDSLARDAVKQAGGLLQDRTKKVIDKTTTPEERAKRMRGIADKDTIDLTKQTYEKLFTATYKAEEEGGDTNALGNLLVGVKFLGGEIAPDKAGKGVMYNVKDNTLSLPIKEGKNIVYRTIDLKDEGEEKLVNAILKHRGVSDIDKASAILPDIISTLDPENQRFEDINPNDFN
jgi:hypothetical protein